MNFSPGRTICGHARRKLALHLHAGVELAGKVVIGPHERATLRARSLIDRWLKEHPRTSNEDMTSKAAP